MHGRESRPVVDGCSIARPRPGIDMGCRTRLPIAPIAMAPVRFSRDDERLKSPLLYSMSVIECNGHSGQDLSLRVYGMDVG
jgi:hypothetical protein